MGKAALPAVGLLGAGLLAWYAWRRHVRAGLPGSVEPEQGGRDEAPPGSVDVAEVSGENERRA
jgi:hypothetical protein